MSDIGLKLLNHWLTAQLWVHKNLEELGERMVASGVVSNRGLAVNGYIAAIELAQELQLSSKLLGMNNEWEAGQMLAQLVKGSLDTEGFDEANFARTSLLIAATNAFKAVCEMDARRRIAASHVPETQDFLVPIDRARSPESCVSTTNNLYARLEPDNSGGEAFLSIPPSSHPEGVVEQGDPSQGDWTISRVDFKPG